MSTHIAGIRTTDVRTTDIRATSDRTTDIHVIGDRMACVRMAHPDAAHASVRGQTSHVSTRRASARSRASHVSARCWAGHAFARHVSARSRASTGVNSSGSTPPVKRAASRLSRSSTKVDGRPGGTGQRAASVPIRSTMLG